MWSLEKPDIDQVSDELERALSRDRGESPYALTNAERDAVVQRYPSYDAVGGLANPALAEPTASAALSDAIHDAYLQVQVGARLENLREKIKSGARLCPYCGAPTITDLDHYLPRSVYKDFAIYPRNLVPSCHPCNNIKRGFNPTVPNENLIQPYFDEMPEAPFLVARVQIAESGGLNVVFDIDAVLMPSDQLRARTIHQIELFKLNDRLLTPINVFLASLSSAFDLAFSAGGGVALADFLLRTANSHASTFGINDWRTALLRALANHHEFCHGEFQVVLGGINLGDGVA